MELQAASTEQVFFVFITVHFDFFVGDYTVVTSFCMLIPQKILSLSIFSCSIQFKKYFMYIFAFESKRQLVPGISSPNERHSVSLLQDVYCASFFMKNFVFVFRGLDQSYSVALLGRHIA